MTGYLYRGRPGLEELNARIMADRAANGTTEPGQRGTISGHGTDARARRHRAQGEKPCPACAKAEAREHARRKAVRAERSGRAPLETSAAAGKELPPRKERIPMDLIGLEGKNVLVRTVTHYYTGKLAGQVDGTHASWLHLEDTAWIADTGRFSDALATGTLDEVEPYPGECFVAVGAVVDISHWPHKLPRSKK